MTASLQLRGPVGMGAGHVAEKAAEDKCDIYRLLEQPFRFVPLVYESHGRACEETQEFLFQSAIAAAKRFGVWLDCTY